jgi:hypothetical protein
LITGKSRIFILKKEDIDTLCGPEKRK